MPVRVGNIREWSGEDVVDEAGDKIGKLESVYVDTATDQPAFVTVTVGVMSKKLVFVPIDDAVVGPGYVKVPYSKNQVKEAPHIETDGELRAEAEGEVFSHYGLAYDAAPSERRLGRR